MSQPQPLPQNEAGTVEEKGDHGEGRSEELKQLANPGEYSFRNPDGSQRFAMLQLKLLCSTISFFHRHIRTDKDVMHRMGNNPIFDFFYEQQYHTKTDLPQVFRESVVDSNISHVCSFILSILHQGIFSVSAFVVSVIYLSRFKEVSHITLHSCTWRPLFLTTLLVADKMWEDKPVRNSSLAKLFPVLNNKDLNQLENIFLRILHFNVLVKPDLFCTFCEKLLVENIKPEIVEAVLNSEYGQALACEEHIIKNTQKLLDLYPRNQFDETNFGTYPIEGCLKATVAPRELYSKMLVSEGFKMTNLPKHKKPENEQTAQRRARSSDGLRNQQVPSGTKDEMEAKRSSSQRPPGVTVVRGFGFPSMLQVGNLQQPKITLRKSLPATLVGGGVRTAVPAPNIPSTTWIQPTMAPTNGVTSATNGTITPAKGTIPATKMTPTSQGVQQGVQQAGTPTANGQQAGTPTANGVATSASGASTTGVVTAKGPTVVPGNAGNAATGGQSVPNPMTRPRLGNFFTTQRQPSPFSSSLAYKSHVDRAPSPQQPLGLTGPLSVQLPNGGMTQATGSSHQLRPNVRPSPMRSPLNGDDQPRNPSLLQQQAAPTPAVLVQGQAMQGQAQAQSSSSASRPSPQNISSAQKDNSVSVGEQNSAQQNPTKDAVSGSNSQVVNPGVVASKVVNQVVVNQQQHMGSNHRATPTRPHYSTSSRPSSVHGTPPQGQPARGAATGSIGISGATNRNPSMGNRLNPPNIYTMNMQNLMVGQTKSSRSSLSGVTLNFSGQLGRQPTGRGLSVGRSGRTGPIAVTNRAIVTKTSYGGKADGTAAAGASGAGGGATGSATGVNGVSITGTAVGGSGANSVGHNGPVRTPIQQQKYGNGLHASPVTTSSPMTAANQPRANSLGRMGAIKVPQFQTKIGFGNPTVPKLGHLANGTAGGNTQVVGGSRPQTPPPKMLTTMHYQPPARASSAPRAQQYQKQATAGQKTDQQQQAAANGIPLLQRGSSPFRPFVINRGRSPSLRLGFPQFQQN